MNDKFKEKLQRGDILLGTIISLPSADVTEIIAGAGFDWLFVDMEHGALDMADVQNILRAAKPDVPCLVRVPANEEVWIKRCLDSGPAGIIFPHINSADDALRAVELSKYPPQGVRSVGVGRASGFGSNFKSYLANANPLTAVVIQIEHIDAVENIESIVNVDGIDALFVGPYDLSASMGKIGRLQDPEVRDAISRVRRSAQAADIPLGVFGADPERLLPHLEEGFTLLAVATDSLIIGTAAARLIRSLNP